MQESLHISEVDNNTNTQSSVGIVLYKGPNGLCTMATGFLVGPNLVLTTAYCVYSIQQQKLNSEFGQIYFLPGSHGKIGKPYKVIDSRFPQEYKQCDQASKRFVEFSLLKLQTNVQKAHALTLGVSYTYSNDDKLSFFGYSTQDVSELDEYYQMLSKKEEETNTSATVAQSQITNNTWWNVIDNVLIQHKFQTKAGSGGSPIVLWRKNQPIVVAMHIVRRRNSEVRIGRLMTEDLTENIGKWSKEMQCSSPIFKNLKQNIYFASENYMKKYDEVCRANEQLLKSNLVLRQQSQNNRVKYESLFAMLEQFRGIDKLPLQEIIPKLTDLNQLLFKHSLVLKGISNIFVNQDQSNQSILQGLSQ